MHYELFSISVHAGNLDSGHYYAFIKHHEDRQWYICDDTSVRKTHWNYIQKKLRMNDLRRHDAHSVTGRRRSYSRDHSWSQYWCHRPVRHQPSLHLRTPQQKHSTQTYQKGHNDTQAPAKNYLLAMGMMAFVKEEQEQQALDNFPVLLYILAAKTLLLCLGFAATKMYQSRKAEAALKKQQEQKRLAAAAEHREKEDTDKKED
ncbi:UBP27 hydrolase, partial [Polyodon spathula]|nr:UBP27 hydrolase [Polyodon spathula]